MKKAFCILLILIFLCGCATTNSENSTSSENFTSSESSSSSENIEESEAIDMSFDSYYGEGSDDFIEFINNPWDNQLYSDLHIIFRFEENNGQLLLTGISSEDGYHNQGPFLALDDPDNYKWQEIRSSEYFQQAIAFLCDEDAIKECFRENGVESIQKIVILNLDVMGYEVGYVIAAITETQAYFMTVPISNEKYGDYIFQKVYTKDEFSEIFGPRPAKVFINDTETAFSTTPLLGYAFLEMELFELLDVLDVQYTYDKDHRTISSGDVTVQIDEYNGSYYVEIFKDDEIVIDTGEVRYINEKCIADMIVCERLCRVLGYNTEIHYDDYSVRIVKR